MRRLLFLVSFMVCVTAVVSDRLTLFDDVFCYISEPPQRPLSCLSYRVGTAAAPPQRRPLSGLDALSLSSSSRQSPSPVSISVSRQTGRTGDVCLLRADRSILCLDLLAPAPLPLAEYCAVSHSGVYACGVGRMSVDGAGWIGSALGDDQVDSDTAAGFVYATHAKFSSGDTVADNAGLLLLTWPQRYPTFFGIDRHRDWNVSHSALALVSYFCVPPAAVNDSVYEKLVFARPATVQYDVLHTAFQSVCSANLVACGLRMDGTAICWGNHTSPDWPIVVPSPPSWIHFSALVCQNKLVCAIIAEPSLTGRLLCWPSLISEYSNSYYHIALREQILRHLMYLATAADPVIQQRMTDDWLKADIYDQCQYAISTAQMNFDHQLFFRNWTVYYQSLIFMSDMTILINTNPIISIATSHNELSLLSAGGQYHRVNFFQVLDFSTMWYATIESIRQSPYALAAAFVETGDAAAATTPALDTDDITVHVWNTKPFMPNERAVGTALDSNLRSPSFSAVYMDNIDAVCGLIQTYSDTMRNGFLRCYGADPAGWSFIGRYGKLFNQQYRDIKLFPNPAGQYNIACFQRSNQSEVWDCPGPGAPYAALLGAVTLRNVTLAAFIHISHPFSLLLGLNQTLIGSPSAAATNLFVYSQPKEFKPELHIPSPPTPVNYALPMYETFALIAQMPTTGMYTSVAGNGDFACALDINGSIICWGEPWFRSWAGIKDVSNPDQFVLFGNMWNASNMTLSTFDSPYPILPAPPQYTYTQLCVAGMFACGLTSNGSIICWMGIYGNGSHMAKWSASSVPSSPPSNFSVGLLIPDDTVYYGIVFTQVRCSMFSVCGLSSNGSILCSGFPLTTLTSTNSYTIPWPMYNVTSQNYIAGDDDRHGGVNPRVLDIGMLGLVLGQYCAITAPFRSLRCDSTSALPSVMQPIVPVLAPVGYYQIGGGTELAPCPGSTYSVRRGAVSAACDGPCMAGYSGRNVSQSYSNETCGGACPAGFYCLQGNHGPEPCPAGRYGARGGLTSSSCTQICPAGTYCLAGSKMPTLCSAGTYGATEGLGNESCSGLCKAGHLCPAGSTTSTQSSCPMNSYSLLDGSATCLSCATLSGVECGGGVISISASAHLSIQLTREIGGALLAELVVQPCPSGFCDGISTTDISSHINMTAVALYANSSQSTLLVLPLTDQCGPYHDQSIYSSLCGRCLDGYAPDTTGICGVCQSVSGTKLLLFIFVPFLLVIVFYLFSHGHSGAVCILLYLVQTTVIMLNSQTTSWVTSLLRSIGLSPVSLFADQCLAPMSAEFYFALPLFIPPMQLIQLLILALIHSLVKRCNHTDNDLELDPTSMCYSGPAMPPQSYNSLLWYRLALRYRLWPELSVSTITRTMVLIGVASFTSTTFVSISWFDCSGVGIDNRQVVWSYPTIACDTQLYWQWSMLHLAILTAWVILLVAMIVCTWRFAPLLSALQLATGIRWSELDEIQNERRLRPFCAPSLSLVPITAISSTIWPSSWLNTSARFWSAYWPQKAADFDDVLLQPSTELRSSYVFRSHYGALWDSFTPGAVGWMSVVLLRRLVLLILSVTLSLHSNWKYLSFVVLHVAVLITHNAYQPYMQTMYNHVEQLSIIVHIILAALLLMPELAGPMRNLVIASLVAIPLFSIASLLLFDRWRRRDPKSPLVNSVLMSDLRHTRAYHEPFLSSLSE